MNSKLNLIFLVVVVLSMGCATHPALQNMTTIPGLTDSGSEKNLAPTLVLQAYPRVGFTPLRVTIKAVLHHVPANDPILGCAWQSWAFGDGAVSSEKPHCDGPESSEGSSEYLVEHVYRDEGVYQVRFVLGDSQILSNPVQIRVVGRN